MVVSFRGRFARVYRRRWTIRAATSIWKTRPKPIACLQRHRYIGGCSKWCRREIMRRLSRRALRACRMRRLGIMVKPLAPRRRGGSSRRDCHAPRELGERSPCGEPGILSGLANGCTARSGRTPFPAARAGRRCRDRIASWDGAPESRKPPGGPNLHQPSALALSAQPIRLGLVRLGSSTSVVG